ncbi:hypothetical protein LUZ61_005716 [Rhynchospora tenuis]|uniref:BRCT domain-containing protein n=1 Tax=Rhynchospora tenuis TaxID=198213 RepID=A0AAD6EUU7_9POAL|nr:hypothetical protein LUZ61_005716 [Rhynchospora tenuis]
MDAVSTHDGLETQLVDEDSTELGSPFANCPMEEDNVDETGILFGETQLVEDTCNYEATQLQDDLVDPGFTEVLEDPVGETQLVGDPVGPGFTQILEHPIDMAIETQLVEDMGDWIDKQLVGQEEKGKQAEEEKTGHENGLCEAGFGAWSSGEKEEKQRARKECEEKECLVDSDASTDDESCDSGIIQRRLTSLRVASVRSCALAASRKFSSKLDTDIGNGASKSLKVLSKSSTLDYTLVREKVDSKADNGLNKSKKKMVRQLFPDVAPETERFSPVSADLPPKDSANVYVEDSQDPGILSQENALEVIDKLIASHDVSPTCNEPRKVGNYGSCETAAILPQTSAQAGTIQLAKDIDTSSLAKKSGIFDWDDVKEDETGGDFFVKKKAMFYGKRSQSQPPKGKEKKNTRDLGRSDSRLMSQQRDKISYSTIRKNLFNERENDEQPLERGNDDSFHALSNVGPDTQIAVEAIQALVHGSPGRPGSPEGREVVEIEKRCIPGDERMVCIASSEGVEKTTEKARKSGRKKLMPLVQIYVATKDQSIVPNKIRDDSQKTGLDVSSNWTHIPRKARSPKRTDLLGKTETPLKNLGQNRKRKVFIRSATELVDKAKRCRRVSLSDKEKIGTPSMEIGKGSPVFTPKKSQRKALDGGSYRPSVQKEMLRLERLESSSVTKWKDLRVRRDLAEARVLLSNHLDDKVTRQQRKILKRLQIPEAFSMSDGTHFVADKFFRTRNFLEAMARGKPIVTPSWLERCNLSNQFVDEKNFILRDAKKEKELCFSMPNSLATSSHSPLLKGKRVLITPSVKPSLEVVRSLVIACGGTPMERIVSSLIKGKVRDDLLLISCEEDFQTCRPLLEKGVDAYSSELILNGIIIQKLEFGRHQLFSDRVKRTRSTIWIREEDGDKFVPTAKCA